MPVALPHRVGHHPCPRPRHKLAPLPSTFYFLYYLCTHICACGEIGRRARLRIWCRETCRFESYQAHPRASKQFSMVASTPLLFPASHKQRCLSKKSTPHHTKNQSSDNRFHPNLQPLRNPIVLCLSTKKKTMDKSTRFAALIPILHRPCGFCERNDAGWQHPVQPPHTCHRHPFPLHPPGAGRRHGRAGQFPAAGSRQRSERGRRVVENRCYVKFFTYDVSFFTYDVRNFT